jgi:hypothetical protein
VKKILIRQRKRHSPRRSDVPVGKLSETTSHGVVFLYDDYVSKEPNHVRNQPADQISTGKVAGN